jgi:4-amino-4-deoxy-L-arabinose transferase-like glycosyltransferase
MLLGILVAAVTLRGYWVIHHGAVLVGCEYARIAESLLKHGTYLGLFEGPELVFPPFFPILLALGAPFAGSVDGATRLVPCLAGVLLVPAMFALARLVYGPRVALGAAALTALHPLLIDLSSVALSEGTYLLLMVMSLYWGLRSLDSGKPAHSVWCGAMIGLAYLTRPEAFFYPFVVLAAALATDRRGPAFVRRFALRALCLLAPIVVLMAPYVAYLSVHMGSLRFEGKGIMNYTIGERLNLGMSPYEAALGIGPDLSEDGPQLSPNDFVATTHRRLSVRELANYWVASARRNKAPLLQHLLLSPMFGSALAMGLITLGLFRRPWTQRRARCEGVFLAIAAGHLVLLLGLHFINVRYLFPLVPLSLLWIAQGIDGAARWGVGTARLGTARWRLPAPWFDTGIRCVLVGAVLLLALWGVRWASLRDVSPETLLLRDVGTWLGDHTPGPKRVMSVDPLIPCYSGGTFLPMPYAEASDALRYVHTKHPDFIVLIREERYVAPYLKQWLEEGIPDRSAKLIYRAGPASPAAVVIYEWHN